jgi:NRAMP (natural resistance-associated macrophage protein)-like metal ion transporter
MKPASPAPSKGAPRRVTLRRVLAAAGPGIVTGAADDDPSGIVTYTIAGARFGTGFLWTSLLTWPLMAVVQMTCARVGLAGGTGLAGAMRERLPRPLLVVIAAALFLANTVNVAADLAGMADAANVLSGVDARVAVVVFGAAIFFAMERLRYTQIASVLKWLTLALLAYVVTAVLVKPDWAQVFRDTAVPSLPRGREAIQTLVAILGTTISPYLFFWQASQEVEERSAASGGARGKRGATSAELVTRGWDVGVGTFISNLVMFSIIVAAAATLHHAGAPEITSSRQAALALKPFAGSFATVLFTLGVLGTGFLAIPTLAGSAAYAFAETLGWRKGLDKTSKRAPGFYAVVLLSVGGGVALAFARVNPMAALFWSAVLNGILAPLLLAGLIFVARDRRLMKGKPVSAAGAATVGLCGVLMLAAAVAMFAL